MTSYNAVPCSLKDIPQWVAWKFEIRDGKETKVPYDAKSDSDGVHAKVNEPSTWASFERAAEVADVLSGHNYDGVGFVLHGTQFVGFDFDGVLQDGKAEGFVLDILEKCGNPYCEITPSGNGLRTFVEYPLALPAGKRKFSRNTNGKYGAEIYSGSEGGRYLTITGNKFSGNGIPKIADIQLVYFMVSQITNEKMKALWMGDLSAYAGDQSCADMALLGILARLFGNDVQKIERAFGASKLGQRDKWTQRKDYRDRTIAKAISGEEPKNEPTAAPQSVEVGKCEPEPEITEEPLPGFPRFTGSLADMSEALAPDLPYCLKLMSAVTIVGSLLAGKVYIAGSTHIDPRFYTVMIDTKGAGKGGSWNEVRGALGPLILDNLNIAPSIDSGPALVLELAEHPRTLLYADELDKVFETAKPTGSSRNSLFAELLTLYDGHETGNNAKANFQLPKETRDRVCKNGSASINITNARFSLLGGVQPDVFATMWRGVKGGANGLQSRFVLVSSGNNSVPEPQRAGDRAVIRQSVDGVVEQVLRYIDTGAPKIIGISDDLAEQLRT